MRVFSAVAAAAALLAGASVAAAADTTPDAAAIRAKVTAAQGSVTSFHLVVTGPGMSGVGTVVTKPMLMHLEMASGPAIIDMYLDASAKNGVTMYQQIGKGGRWTAMVLPGGAALQKTLATMLPAVREKSTVVAAPDVVEGGVTYGAFSVETPTASIPGAPTASPMTMTCTYDKTTYLVHSCSNGIVTQTFSAYNDPANVVTIPPDARSAPTTAFPFAPSSPSPAP